MAGLSLKHIYKVYPNGTKAVNDFNMEIEDKEFIVFVGPSGCGKSTTLRMIAGLEDISAGELKIGDLVVNDIEPKDRDIAMVFQNYALYPHMTVYENIAFGLRLRKIPDIKRDKDGNPVLDKNGNEITVYRHYTKDEINAKVMEAANILGIVEYLGKKPKEMSGGQRQRVSLGRAIVREPKVMLLDEPLSNLDAKLRTQMRAEISKLHTKLNTTFIYVTHDQVEAMTMGTRIVVMKLGFVQQIDTPKNLYNYPGNKFVAGFIGTPQMNFFEGTLKKVGDNIEVRFEYSDAMITVPYSHFYKIHPGYLHGDKKVCIGIRAEDISLDPAVVKNSKAVIKIVTSHKEELGNETLLYGDINMSGDGYTESSTRVILKSTKELDYKAGDIIDVALDLDHMHIFDAETEVSILPRIPEYNYLDCEVKGRSLSFLGQNIALPAAINCADGQYELIIPSDALSEGNGIQAEITNCEHINGKILISFVVSGRTLFAVVDKDMPLGKANFAIDLKKISLSKDGEPVVASMPEVMSLDGKLIKEKVVREVEVDGKVKNKKVIDFYLGIEDAKLPAPEEVSSKLIPALGARRAFDEELIFECGPYDLKVAEEGITAQVESIADYGKEKFAVCKIGEKLVYVHTDTELSGTVHLVPEIDKLSVIQKRLDIRII